MEASIKEELDRRPKFPHKPVPPGSIVTSFGIQMAQWTFYSFSMRRSMQHLILLLYTATSQYRSLKIAHRQAH